MIRTGFADVHKVYLTEPDMAQLSLASLQGLRGIAPELEYRANTATVDLAANGHSIASVPRPRDGSLTDWTALTVAMVDEGRHASPSLAGAADERIYDALFSGVARQLDQYSRYSGTELARENRAKRQGFGGIGVIVEPDAEGARVVDIANGTPAATAGLAVGDRIISIEGRSIIGFPLQDIVEMLRGPVATKVQLAVRRPNAAGMQSFLVERAHIVPSTVEYARQGGVAIVKLTGFNKRTADSVREMVEQARRELGPKLEGLIIDLRDNPGGLLDQAVDVADLFLDSGRIISTEGRHPDSLQLFDAREGDIAKGVPIAVVVNGATASAAEIVAAALQDQNRAVVVGTTSFGKGTVQTVLRLPNNGELILTWARLHAPSGYTLNRIGISPAVCTSTGETPGGILAATLDEQTSPIRERLRQRRAADSDDDPQRLAMKASCPWRPRTDETFDLTVAAALLRDPAAYRRAILLSAPSAVDG
ncbi:MAG: S41 family peptidase [Alphaproteobacteria bacterium]